MHPPQKVILYDVPTTQGPLRHCLPNPWVARMCLAHKGIDFETRDVTLADLRARGPGTLQERLRPCLDVNERPLVPIIEVVEADGSTTLVGDTMDIAEYLDIAFPSQPSLYVPSHAGPGPVDCLSTAFIQAYAYARFVKEGLGGSDSRWSTHFELISTEIADSFQDHEREMLAKESGLNILNGKERFAGLDRATLIAHTRRSLLPLCAILKDPPRPRIVRVDPSQTSSSLPSGLARPRSSQARLFLASPERPGLVDYILFGRYAVTRALAPDLNDAIWTEDSSLARKWLDTYRGGRWALTGQDAEEGKWDGDVALPGIEGWVQRMLDAHGGYARQFFEAEAHAH